MKYFQGLDWVIVLIILVFAGFSLTIIYSVFPNLFTAQLLFFVIGFGLLFIFSNIDYHYYQNLWLPIYIISCLLLLVTFVIGIESRGAVRWIEIGGVRLQLSEVLKPFIIASLGAFLINKPPFKIKNLLMVSVLFILPCFLVFKQPDLGNAIVYGFSFLSIIYVSGIPVVFITVSAVLSLILSPIFWHILKDYQKARIISFLNPQNDPLGSSYNAIQAVIAVGSGMIWGKGLGHGTQSHLLFLPERHTDFIFASLSEELGFVGAALLLIIYSVLCLRVFKLINGTRNEYGRSLLTGFLFIILSQVFINIGMNIGLLPITGITLPLVSYGGSSVLSMMIIFGIMENIAKQEQVR